MHHDVAYIKLSDGTTIKLKIAVVDIKEGAFSPFGDISFEVKPIGGVSIDKIPDELKKKVSDKPVSLETGIKGWEIIGIVEKECAEVEVVVDSSKGKFKVKVEAEPVMAARNMNYKSLGGEPHYYINWVWKVSWEPIKE